MKIKISVLIGCVLLIGICSGEADYEFSYNTFYGAVYDTNTTSWSIGTEDQILSWTAWGFITNNNTENGWYVLNMESMPMKDNNLQAYGLGFLEGALTQPLIWETLCTFWNGTTPPPLDQKYQNWLETNANWSRSMAKAHAQSDEFWAQVELFFIQMDGLYAGYNQYAPQDQQLSLIQFLLLQAGPDFMDIINALGGDLPPSYAIQNSHCSSLIKLSDDGNTLFSGHVTWGMYTAMLRIYKHITTAYDLPSMNGMGLSFSSYPGSLVSGDDFYIASSGLVIMETTNSVFNMSLYKYVQPESLLYGVRVTIANRMAYDAAQWAKFFAMYNSGTYNNQWMIINYNLFTPGSPIRPNTLWIAEQIPGWVVSGDKSDTLSATGYWASYNIPYFPFVYNISGYQQQYEQQGNQYSYSMCPRAQIFRRDQGKIESMEDFQRMMRYNKWQTDPLSLGDACNGVSARCDLNPPALNPFTFGGIDCKVTNNTMVPDLKSLAVSGPTWQSQPVFAWTEQWEGVPHYGQVDEFDFDFVEMKPYVH